MPLTLTDLTPPVGTRSGLPLTVVWADNDSLSYTGNSATGQPMKNLSTSTLWEGDSASPVSPTDKPKVVQGVTTIQNSAYDAPLISAVGSASVVNISYHGQMLNTSSPVLNFGTGDLEYSQMMLHTVRGRNINYRTQPVGTVMTFTKAGRYNTRHVEEYDGSPNTFGAGRPANHTWHRFSTHRGHDQAISANTDILPAHDVYAGRYNAPSPTAVVGLGIVHDTKVCLPSNGMGATYGDNHNIKYAVSLNSSPLTTIDDEETGLLPFPDLSNTLEDSYKMSSHWAINVQSNQPIPVNTNGATYKNISQPDGLGAGADYSSMPQQPIPVNETIQYIGTNDFVSAVGTPITDPSEKRWRPLGRPDLGNLCVTDSCGLIGYEGLITATAFMSVSEEANPANGGTWSGANQATFAGINIQVHSGTSPRRNGKSYRTLSDADRTYRYGTDGNYIKPITEALMTTGNRDAFQGAGYYSTTSTETDNQSRFAIGRCHQPALGASPLALNTNPTGSSNTGQQIINPVAYILGDNGHLNGGAYTKTSSLSQDFMKNMIPTKIQVIPALVSHKQVTVPAGSQHPSSGSFKFNKPLVDYHVLVSLTPRNRLTVKGTNGGMTGNPTSRNAPDARTFAYLNLKDEGCYIYHAIFRINPDLERIFVDSAESAELNSPLDIQCQKSVMPRNWNLIQLTPFKPIASAGFAEVPLLSGAIEAGGFYQQGGISHHWSADVFNDELFVATDVIEMAHLNSQIYGTGQVKAGGGSVGTPAIPDGPEMMIFKYSPSQDPFYTSKEHDVLQTWYLSQTLIGGTDSTKRISSGMTFNLSQATGTDKIKIERVQGHTGGWSIHDWVFPQLEAMSYLGIENKAFMKHPRHSQNSSGTPILHPTLHVGDFQIMEDGRMKILAIHRDRITSNIDYPSPLIGYPPNPDIAQQGRCPAGYYYHNGVCKPINSTRNTIPADTTTTHFDPILGVNITTAGPPTPNLPSGLSYMGGATNFNEIPTWTSMIGDTNARSLVLLFNNKKAREVKGSKLFTYPKTIDDVLRNITLDFEPTLRYELESNPYIFDADTEDGNVYHNWKRDVGFWSGSQLAYWFQESGQKAIPITYGSYPECRMSYPHFAKCLPHLQLQDFLLYRNNTQTIQQCMQNIFSSELMNYEKDEDKMFFVDAKLTRPVSGYPLYQPTVNFSMMNPSNATTYQAWDILRTFPNLVESYKHLFQTHYNPTTIGFADFGMGANPYQELGWAGWSFPQGLYDPTVSDGSHFFSDQPEAVGVTGTHTGLQTNGLWKNFYADTVSSIPQFTGGMAGISHHGPLHYGIMSSDHPFKPDRLWKQVNAGLGYEMPLELLIPEKVQVRARGKAKNSLDLELHLPLHRYKLENNPMIGKIKAQAHGTAASSVMSPYIAQPYLRTNLWNMETSLSASQIATENLNPSQRIMGKPRATGGTQLLQPTFSEFWKDHPTEFFHAGAIPINTGTDYDAIRVASQRYTPALLGNIDSMNKHDYIATAEQLQSSVDVHLSNSIRPYWDSGGIVSARGSGLEDTSMTIYTPTERSQNSGIGVPTHSQSTAGANTNLDDGYGLGMGQRILRTPDGTLHTFSLDRSAKTGTDNIPIWTHYSKPAHSDLFWNRKAVKASNATHDGKDEVGPHLKVLAGATPTNYRIHGSAFASDSNGTIHAIVEIKKPDGQHVLYYTYATRTLVTTQPELVYSWDWSVHTPVLVGGSNNWDLREPSLVCDSKDRLHLACRVVERVDGVIPAGSQILYTIKLFNETTWPTLTSGTGSVSTATGFGGSWQIVSNRPSSDTVANTMTMTKGHLSYDNSYPKICLQTDDAPVVFYIGKNINLGGNYDFSTAYTSQGLSANSVYANFGKVDSGITPSGRFSFSGENATLILGANTNSSSLSANYPIYYYDAVIDSNDMAYVSGWKAVAPNTNSYIVSWNTKEDWSKRFVSTKGMSPMALSQTTIDDTYRYRYMTTTISDKDELHMVFGFTIPSITQGLPRVFTNTGTQATFGGTATPFQWAGTPSSAQLEGFMTTLMLSWPTGGLNVSIAFGERLHFMEMFIPTSEISQPIGAFGAVARDVNLRFLSVPSMVRDNSGNYSPASSPQTMAGHEDFTHAAPQLRYQQFHGHNAGEIDLRWTTNELSWYSNPHLGSKLYYPFVGGATMSIGENTNTGEGIAGWI